MALTNKYTIVPNRLPEIFDKIRDGQAPEHFSTQLLKDWGFTSTNDRAMIPLLKDLSFLSPDGKPTSRYHDYRDHSRSKSVMNDAIREAYSDLFLIKENPSVEDQKTIQGKFKSFHNVSDNVAKIMMKNFYALLPLAELKAKKHEIKDEKKKEDKDLLVDKGQLDDLRDDKIGRVMATGLHYNIQIHLPATKDVEVFNAIFKSIREHLIEE